MERSRSHFPCHHGTGRNKSQSVSINVPVLGFFEALESRMMLTGSAVVDQGVLRIQGDAEANTIDVAIVGDTVTVTNDGTALTPFSGYGTDFSAIRIEAGAGDDTITVSAKDVPTGSEQPLRLAVDGGAGNDSITVSTENVEVAGNDNEHDGLRLSINGGQGNDTIDLAIQGLTVDENARLALEINGDEGEDVVSILAKDAAIAGRVSLRVDLGAGNDTLDLAASSLTVAEAGTLKEQIRGGLGDDTFTQTNSDVSIAGKVNAQVSGNFGDDSFTLTNDTVTVDGSVNADIRGGLGDDSLTLAGSAITINGTVHAQVQGDWGEDTLDNQLADDAVTRGPDAVVDIQAHSNPRWASLLDGWDNPQDGKCLPRKERSAKEDGEDATWDRGQLTNQLRRRLAGLGLRKTGE